MIVRTHLQFSRFWYAALDIYQKFCFTIKTFWKCVLFSRLLHLGGEVNEPESPWCTFWHLRPRLLLWCWKSQEAWWWPWPEAIMWRVSRDYPPSPTDLFFPVPDAISPSHTRASRSHFSPDLPAVRFSAYHQGNGCVGLVRARGYPE